MIYIVYQIAVGDTTMRARLSKWGNSLAVRLPQAAVRSLRVHEGEEVELTFHDDRIELRAARPRYRLEDLVAAITPDNQPESLDVPPAGGEML